MKQVRDADARLGLGNGHVVDHGVMDLEGAAAIVCDTSPQRRGELVDLLRTTGFSEVVETTRAIEVIEQAGARQPHVVLIVLEATGQLGLRALTAVRSVAPTARIVLITPDGALVEQALEAGADAVHHEDDLRQLSVELRAVVATLTRR